MAAIPGCICLVSLLVAGSACGKQVDSRYCSVKSQDVRVLPNTFTRSLVQNFDLTSNAEGQPVEPARTAKECTVLSLDPAFDELLGDDWSLSQLGPTMSYNYAHEGPVYLPGMSCNVWTHILLCN